MKKTSELKFCPFCGGEACAINEKIGCRIVCRECEASVPDQPIWYPEAVKKWNHRHLTSAMHSDGEDNAVKEKLRGYKEMLNLL